MLLTNVGIQATNIARRMGTLMQPEQRNSAQISSGYLLVLSFALATLCQFVLAQEATVKASESIEEIVVYGDKSLSNLRSEMYGAEDDFFAVFNALNSRDEFDIDCDFRTPIGQRRRYHVCTPKFAVKSEAAASARYLQSLHLAAGQEEALDLEAAGADFFSHNVRTRRKEELMWREMKKLLSERPELREALAKVARARNRYESAR